MATDNRKIQIETEVVANTDALQKVEADFKRAADTAVAAGQKGSAGLERMGEGADKASDKVDRSTKSIISAVQRTTVAMKAGGRQTAEFYELLAQQRGADLKALEPYLQKLREVEAAQRAASGGIQQAGKQLDQFGNTAKQTAAALRQVPAQFTDIVVSLQGGTAPLTVLLQQGGQLKDVFGGIAPAAQALGNYIRGLISPMTALAAAAGVLAVGFFKGAQEAQEFQKAIILTGNAAGATAGQMAVMAARIDGVIGTQAKASEVLALLANTGAVGVESFERLTKAAIAFERAGGGAVEDVVKNFAALGKDPLQATLKLNESMNFLTRSTYEQIRSLEEQGRTIEAAKVAQDAYAASLEKATPQLLNNLGLVERAWAGLKDVVKETGDAILSIGRPITPETQLEALRQTLKNAEALRAQAAARGQTISGDSPEIRNLREQIALLEKNVGASQAAAQATRERGLAVKQLTDFEKDSLKYRSDADRFAVAEREIRNKYSLAVREGYISEQQLLDLIAQKRKEIFKDTGTAGESQLAQLRARRTELEQYLAALRTEGTEAKKLTEDEKTRNKLQETLKGNLSDAARAQAVLALQIAEQNTVLAESVRLEEDRVKALKKSVEEYDRLIVKTGSEADAILAQAQAQEAANAAMGKSKTAIAEATLTLLKNQFAEADSSDRFAPAYVASLNSKVEAQKRFVAALKETDYKEINERSQEFLRNSKELERVYQDELKLSGLTSFEREKIVAQRQIELKYAKEIAAIEKSSLTDAQKAQQISILDEAKFRETSAAINKVIQDDFNKTTDQINQSLTDALMRGFESGKDFAKNMRDTIVNMFKTMVLRPIVQAIVNPVALTLTSALGLGSNVAQAATGAGTDMLGTASTLSSAYNVLNTGISTAIANGFGKLAASSFGQSIGLSTQIAGPVTATGQAATQLTSTGQTLSAGLGMAGNALAGYGLQKAISGGYKTGSSGLVDAITVAASAYFGPIAGVVAGVFNRAFGRKLADMGITGEFGGAEGFTGQGYTFEKGGWFRSDRTKLSALDDALRESLSSQFKTIQTQTALLADTLGIGSDAIASFTKDVKLSFQGLTQEQIAQKIKDEFETLGNDLAKVALGTDEFSKSGESASQTLSRLATSLLTVNSAFDLLGYKLYEASLAGGDAASALTELFGSLDAFKQATAAYYEGFYSDAEKLNNATQQVTKSLSDLGLAMPVDKLAYRVEVERALAAGNDQLFASLIKLAPAFAQVTDAAKAAADAAKEQAQKMSRAVAQAAQELYAQSQAATDRAFSALERSIRMEADAAKAALTATYEALVKTLNTQKEAAQAAQQVAEQNVNSIQGIFDLLKTEIANLVDAAGAGMTAAQGRQFIAQALEAARTTGYLPEQDALGEAIRAVTSRFETSNYASAFELRRDRLVLAAQLGELQVATGDQLTVAEQQLKAAKDQLDLLDKQLVEARTNYENAQAQNEKFYADQLAAAQEQINALREIDTSVKGVNTAISNLAEAIRAEAAAAATRNVVVSGGGGGASGGLVSDPVYRSTVQTVAATGTPEQKAEWYSDMRESGYSDSAIRALTDSAVGKQTDFDWAILQQLAGYAKGGYYPGGMALVGEKGPEIINFRNPGMVYNAEQTSTMLGSSVALVDEVRALREDNKAQARAMVQIQARLTKLMERWDSDGVPETRAVA